MELDIKHTIVFSKNLNEFENNKRFIVNQGGSRSSKTYSIIQLLIYLCLVNKNIKISIVRKSFPSLRGSVLKDFIEIMTDLKLYNEKYHNKTEHIYTFLNGSIVEFFSIDDSKKVRGRKRDICYCNEANELNFDDFQQLSLRTTKTLFIDYNPSDNEHWIYDLLKDERSVLIHSTYKDNIYLDINLVKEIENLINVDESYYRVYALGEKPISNTRIYTHFKQFVDRIEYDDYVWAIDFGYTHNAAMVKIGFKDDKIYLEEIIYKTGLIVNDFCLMIKDIIKDNKKIYCDSARPDIIEQLKRMNLNVNKADKSVVEGINYVKSKEIYVHIDSVNIMKEYRLYSWKTKRVGTEEIITDEPVKINDDLMDAIRYGIFSHRNSKKDLNRIRFY